MTPRQSIWLFGLFASLIRPRGLEAPSQYCEREVQFNEPGCVGRCNFAGREYLREPIDNVALDSVQDQIMVFGTRAGKTRILYCIMFWILMHVATRMLFVKPTTKGTAGAENDARTRFIPMLRASKVSAAVIPTGTERHNFKTAQQILAGSIVDWTGSNSVANLASNPARAVFQDEVDKFNTTRKRDSEGNEVEADASSLADERCKEFSNPKRFKSGTPTLFSGNTWQELLKSDLRRRFLPCPHCGRDHPSSRRMAFAWSKQFTVLPSSYDDSSMAVAFLRWDHEAKRPNGDWDYDRVERSARYECPHCGGHIRDAHKTWMDRNGIWIPTQQGAPGYKGYHLPSMYCAHRETNFGRMAIKFLKQKRSVSGLQGFINSDLAEPYLNQEVSVNRTEIIRGNVEITAEWTHLQTVDCQQKAPYFWVVSRAWSGTETHGVVATSCDQWDEVQAIQRKPGHEVKDCAVMVDSGFGAKDDAEVYRTCAEHSEIIASQQEQLPICLGWMPAKGMDTRKRWTDTDPNSPTRGLLLPWRYQFVDPYTGLDKAGLCRIQLFEFSTDFFRDILANLRLGKGLIKWSVDESVATELYWKHMDSHEKREVVNRATNSIILKWMKRHRYWPDHLAWCETAQIAFASALGIFSYQPMEIK